MQMFRLTIACVALLLPSVAAAQVAPPVNTSMDDTTRRGTVPSATQCLNPAGTSWVGCQPNRTATSLVTGQVTVGTSSTQVVALRTGRLKLTVSVGAANTCYYGPSGVTTANGFAMQPVAGATMTFDYSGSLSMTCSASTVISFAEAILMRYLLLALALLATPAVAQVSYPPPDLSSVASKSDVATAKATADQAAQQVAQAKATADAAALTAAAACPPGSSIPKMEAVTPSAGTASTCVRSDFVPMRISRTVSGVTTTGGLGTVSWPSMPSTPKLTVTPYVSSTTSVQAPICIPVSGTVTTTGATIKCFSTQTITVSVLGAVVAPVTTAAAGVAFDVLALPGS